MKKNKMMRLASVLLVVTLLTTSVISGTFAKYTTQDSADDVARVAKWGVALQVIGNLYGETYKDAIVANDASSLTVQANDATAMDVDDDVVAPGTENKEGFKFSLTGTPEVSTQAIVTIKAQNVFLNDGTYGLMVEVPTGTVTAQNFGVLGDLYTKTGDAYTKVANFDAAITTYYTLEDYVVVTDSYYPVVYALAGDTNYTGTHADDTINAIAAAIAGKFGNCTPSTDADTNITTYTVTSADIAPNTDLDTKFAIDDEVITWAWAFDGDTSGDNATENSKADTILGLLMTRAAAGADVLDGTVVKLDDAGTSYKAPVEHTDYCLDTSFSIDITVNQVD